MARARYGYMGRLLFVDLTDGKWHEEELSEDTARRFVGGLDRGIGRSRHEDVALFASAVGPQSKIERQPGENAAADLERGGSTEEVHEIHECLGSADAIDAPAERYAAVADLDGLLSDIGWQGLGA